MDKIERDQFMKNVHYWALEIKKNPVDLDNVVPGDCLISNHGLCFEVIKLNKKTIGVKCLFLKAKNIKENRFDKLPKTNDPYSRIFYKVSRQELVWFWMYQAYAREIKKEKQQELVNLSHEYEKKENEQLDRIVAKYNPVKECECITHEGSCWINMQRYLIHKNAELLRSGGQLAEFAFTSEESARLSDLAYELEFLEKQVNEK